MAALILMAGLATLPAAAQSTGATPDLSGIPGPPADRGAAGAPDSTVAPAVEPAAAPGDPWAALEPALPRGEPRPLARRAGAAPVRRDAAPAADTRTGTSLRTTLALLGVVALILLLGWGYRQVAGRGGLGWVARGRRPGLLEVVSRTMLAPRQSLCLVRLGPRLVLVGLTPGRMTALDVIQDADLVAQLCGLAAQGRADSATAAFARCLEAEAAPYRGAPSDTQLAKGASAPAGLERVAALRAHLNQAIQRLRAQGHRAPLPDQ